MGRKCSNCGRTGHNSRTCTPHYYCHNQKGGGNGGVKLFGVQLATHQDENIPLSSSPLLSINDISDAMMMKKSFSYNCLQLSGLISSSTTTTNTTPSSSSSSRISVDDYSDKMSYYGGYLSDGLIGTTQERKKGMPWTEEEHRTFLVGLEKLGKGDWRGISREFVTTRTPTQVASHAQKYFLRQNSFNNHKKRRPSLFDTVERDELAAQLVNANTFVNYFETHNPRCTPGLEKGSTRYQPHRPVLLYGSFQSSHNSSNPEVIVPNVEKHELELTLASPQPLNQSKLALL